MQLVRLCSGLVAAALAAAAASLPTANNALGPLYPVAEQSLLVQLEIAAAAYVSSGAAGADLQRTQEAAAAYVSQPPAAADPERAQRNEVRMFDPSVALEVAVRDAAGNIIHPAGSRINPLEYGSLDARLVLFDGTDPVQQEFAARIAQAEGKTYPILVAGSPAGFAARTGLRAYFDQNGAIARRFAIESYPAVISQQGTMLRIETRALTQPGK